MNTAVKKIIQKIRYSLKQITKQTKDFIYQRYGETQQGIRCIGKILSSTLLSYYFIEGVLGKRPSLVLILLGAIILYALLTVVEKISRYLIKPFLFYKIETIIVFLITAMVISSLIQYGDTSYDSMVVFCIIFCLIELIFARTIWSLLKNKKMNLWVILPLCFTAALNVCIGILFFGEGFPDKNKENYVALGTLKGDKIIEYQELYTVESFSYGVSEDDIIQTGTTNLSRFTSYNGDFSKYLRKKYWGYGIDQVPLNGQIWMPKEGENHPTLFIIHGNHTMVTPSYMGYEYIGEYLAKCGYVVISVDEACLNGYIDKGLIEENDARAILLLENIKKILKLNWDVQSPLYQKIDDNNIAIAGHSRGGEAVAVAALFNRYDNYPDNGNIRFDYNFDIKTVFAIAPTCDQYEPGDRSVVLEDINYFLIHGSNDMDVTEFMGMKQYQNVEFTTNDLYRKAYLYLAGANHGQFNTKWGRFDSGFPVANILNTASLISGDEQREILLNYLKVSLDVTLKNDTTNEDFLKDCSPYQNNLPSTIYIQGYEDSSYEVICDYEEDSEIDVGTMTNSSLYGNNIVWMEKYIPFTDVSESAYGDRDNYGVRLNWNKTTNASYTIDISKCDYKSLNSLQFDIVNLDDQSVKDHEFEAVDFHVVIHYENGTQKSYLLSDYLTVYPPIEVCISKVDYIFRKSVYKHHFQTAILPLENKNVKINSIQFVFDQTDSGLIMLDNIGFSENRIIQ